MRRKWFAVVAFFLSALLFSHAALARTFQLPPGGQSLVGQVQYDSSEYNDNVITFAERYDLGVDQIADANPHINPQQAFASGITLKIPTAFILPPVPRKGIVINLSEMRLYYYPANSDVVKTYPVGIGKVGKTIPVTKTYVASKMVNPTWTPTPAIREFNREQGVDLPQNIPPGPDNPLGPYAIYLGIPTFRIHSTIFPESVGRRASFGCIRMIEDDIKDFFDSLPINTPVNIIDTPTKVGWEDNKLFLEAHPPLEEHEGAQSTYEGMVRLIQQATAGKPTLIDWQLVGHISETHDGVPHQVGVRLR